MLDFTIFVSEDNGPFTSWLTNTIGLSKVFKGEQGKTYSFYSVARDRVGNVEDAPAVPDASTLVMAETRKSS